MAAKPKEVRTGEACSRCRPATLGVNKRLREFELLVPESSKKGNEGAEARDKNASKANEKNESTESVGDWGVKAEELEQDLKSFGPFLQLTAPLSASKQQEKNEPAVEAPTKSAIPIPAPIPITERNLEQLSDSVTPTSIQERNERWVDICPPSAIGEAAPSAKLTAEGGSIISRIFCPFGGSSLAKETAP